jgi:hypothetical protein
MKNKKTFRTLIIALSVTTLFLAATSVSAKVARETMDFDSITDGRTVQNGYGFLRWEGFTSLDAVNYDLNPSGYEAGLISSSNVVYGEGSARILAKTGTAFLLKTAYMTAAWNDNLQVVVKGYLNGRLMFSATYILSATEPRFINFPDNKPVTEVTFESSGGTQHEAYEGSGEHFLLDDLTVVIGQ